MTITLATYDEGRLAQQLREYNLPGQRSKTAIVKLRRLRTNRAAPARAVQDIHARLNERLVRTYSAEILRRGGEITIDEKNREVPLSVTDRCGGLTLLHVTAWRHYSSGFGARRAQLSYLCGREDGQLWAVRVPGTMHTVRDALAWITPAAVFNARSAGRAVTRQGDVYAVETTTRYDGHGQDELPERHTWNPSTRVLSHPEHADIHLPYPVRFIRQRVYGMGRGAGRACGD